jgi:hypothetical protein
MTTSANPGPASRQERDLEQNSARNDFTLQDEWAKEADQTIDESALRRKPDWIEAIGDEDEDDNRIEQNLRDEFERRGEDDYVSDPTTSADSPDWVNDEYDDEADPEDESELDNFDDIRNSKV